MEKIIQIRTDNTVTASIIDGSLKSLQAEVGGYIQIVKPRALDDRYVLIINEEGKLKGLPANAIATGIYKMPGDFIVGDAVLMKEKGEDLVGLTDSECSTLLTWIETAVSSVKGA